LRALHLVFGLAAFTVFLATGQYMRTHFPEAYAGHEAVRYLYRGNHIYLLLASLVHLAFGAYAAPDASPGRRSAQWVGSGFLMAGTLLLAAAFFQEPPTVSSHRPLTHFGIFTMVGGTALHLLAGVTSRRGSAAP
jgi:hypothetical protein